MKAFTPLLVIALSGCAYDVAKRANVSGNEVSVTVNNVWNANQAFPIADEHCHKYGKAARLSHSGEYAFGFDCVAP